MLCNTALAACMHGSSLLRACYLLLHLADLLDQQYILLYQHSTLICNKVSCRNSPSEAAIGTSLLG